MQSASISTFVQSLREEIKIIQNQERLYRTKRHHSSEEIAAHSRRELRLLDIQAELHKLGRSGPCPEGCNLQLPPSAKPGKHF
jgi:hypothetical protein